MRRCPVLYCFLFILCAAVLCFGQPASTKPVPEVKGYEKSKILEPGSNLVMENLPSIPLELVEAVKRYTESKPVGVSEWHPIRREMLVGKRAGNAGQVHLLTTPLGELKQLTNFPDPVGGGSWQPTEGKYFLFFKATGGNEISQLYRYDADTGTVTRLTNDDKMRIGGGPCQGPDIGPHSAPSPGRRKHTRESRHCVRKVQPAQGKPHAGASSNAAADFAEAASFGT